MRWEQESGSGGSGGHSHIPIRGCGQTPKEVVPLVAQW